MEQEITVLSEEVFTLPDFDAEINSSNPTISEVSGTKFGFWQEESRCAIQGPDTTTSMQSGRIKVES